MALLLPPTLTVLANRHSMARGGIQTSIFSTTRSLSFESSFDGGCHKGGLRVSRLKVQHATRLGALHLFSPGLKKAS